MKLDDCPDAEQLAILCRQHAPEAINKAIEIMRNTTSDQTALKAIDLLIHRGYGRTPIVPLVSNQKNQMEHLTTEEKVQVLQDALNKEKKKLTKEFEVTTLKEIELSS